VPSARPVARRHAWALRLAAALALLACCAAGAHPAGAGRAPGSARAGAAAGGRGARRALLQAPVPLLGRHQLNGPARAPAPALAPAPAPASECAQWMHVTYQLFGPGIEPFTEGLREIFVEQLNCTLVEVDFEDIEILSVEEFLPLVGPSSETLARLAGHAAKQHAGRGGAGGEAAAAPGPGAPPLGASVVSSSLSSIGGRRLRQAGVGARPGRRARKRTCGSVLRGLADWRGLAVDLRERARAGVSARACVRAGRRTPCRAAAECACQSACRARRSAAGAGGVTSDACVGQRAARPDGAAHLDRLARVGARHAGAGGRRGAERRAAAASAGPGNGRLQPAPGRAPAVRRAPPARPRPVSSVRYLRLVLSQSFTVRPDQGRVPAKAWDWAGQAAHLCLTALAAWSWRPCDRNSASRARAGPRAVRQRGRPALPHHGGAGEGRRPAGRAGGQPRRARRRRARAVARARSADGQRRRGPRDPARAQRHRRGPRRGRLDARRAGRGCAAAPPPPFAGRRGVPASCLRAAAPRAARTPHLSAEAPGGLRLARCCLCGGGRSSRAHSAWR